MAENITVAVESVNDSNRAIAVASRYLAFEDANEGFVNQEILDIETALVNGEMKVSFLFDSLDPDVESYFQALDDVATKDEYRYGCRVVRTSV